MLTIYFYINTYVNKTPGVMKTLNVSDECPYTDSSKVMGRFPSLASKLQSLKTLFWKFIIISINLYFIVVPICRSKKNFINYSNLNGKKVKYVLDMSNHTSICVSFIYFRGIRRPFDSFSSNALENNFGKYKAPTTFPCTISCLAVFKSWYWI